MLGSYLIILLIIIQSILIEIGTRNLAFEISIKVDLVLVIILVEAYVVKVTLVKSSILVSSFLSILLYKVLYY